MWQQELPDLWRANKLTYSWSKRFQWWLSQSGRWGKKRLAAPLEDQLCKVVLGVAPGVQAHAIISVLPAFLYITSHFHKTEWCLLSAPKFSSRRMTKAAWRMEAGLTLTDRPRCSPVEHKQFLRTSASQKVPLLTIMDQHMNMLSCLNMSKNTNTAQITKMTKHPPSLSHLTAASLPIITLAFPLSQDFLIYSVTDLPLSLTAPNSNTSPVFFTPPHVT